MKVVAFELLRLAIPFKTAFGHAAGTRLKSDGFLVFALDDQGQSGVGEIQPRAYVTGEDHESVRKQHLPRLAQKFAGVRFDSFERVVVALADALPGAGRALASFGGVELALLDLAGKCFGRPAASVLGPPHDRPLEESAVIGFEVETAALERHCVFLRFKGKGHPKLKVGLADDKARVEIVARTFGVPVRLDANATWSAEEAIERLSALSKLPIHSVEQPVAAGDLAGLRRVREKTGLLVMADESLVTLEDGQRLIAEQAADLFYVRLGKNGGLCASQRLVELATAAGKSCLLGTMVGETGVLSKAAADFAARVPGFHFIDGQGQSRTLLSEDPASQWLGEGAPGLGLSVALGDTEKYGEPERYT